MTLSQRMSQLLQSLEAGITEREFCFELTFLATILKEPVYLYGRSGSGKSLIIKRIWAAFKDGKVFIVNKRHPNFPEHLQDYGIVTFQSFDGTDEMYKKNAQIGLCYKDDYSLIITGAQRPEVALNAAEIAYKMPLIVSVPESLSSSALCSLLQDPEVQKKPSLAENIAVTAEEKKEWADKIMKITLSPDTLEIIGKIAEVCANNNIYIPIRKWIAYSNMMKAIAFFNERTETRMTDTLFLGTYMWGRNSSNKLISESFRNLLKEKLVPEELRQDAKDYDLDNLVERVEKITRKSNNRYDSILFAGEFCVTYSIVIGGEKATLYVPVRYIETSEDFHPYGDTAQQEKAIKCNFHGTTNCSIAVHASVKQTGLRGKGMRNTTNLTGPFDHFASLPTAILKGNDNDIIMQKKAKMEGIEVEIKRAAEKESRKLLELKKIYHNLNGARNDLFLYKEIFNELQDHIRKEFELTSHSITKIKEVHKLVTSIGV